MEKIIMIEKIKDELDRITLKEKRIKECIESLRTFILPAEVEIRINNILNKALEELRFYEEELKRDLGVMVYNG